MNKIAVGMAAFFFVFCANAKPSSSLPDEANALFAKGEYLQGMNLLTKAMNAPDTVERATAIQTYAHFYENIVGNVDYALNFYNDILRTNLPDEHPLKSAARKDVSRIKALKVQFAAEDAILKKLQHPELISRGQREKQIAQLQLIIEQKPTYYKLCEVYYQLGLNLLAVENYHDAYAALKKSLELKPGINFFLPINVWADAAYGKWVRLNINRASWGIVGGLLVLTIIVFYACRPWRWLGFRHLAIGALMVALWLIVFGISYIWLTGRPGVSDKTMFEASVVPPYFFSYGPDSPFWSVTRALFTYGLVGVLGLFVFSIGMSRIKCRRAAMLINFVFAVLLFTSLSTIFYMRNCDQKSMFNSEAGGRVLHYLDGSNYFVTVGMEPYVLTNPKAYPDLTADNIADPHLHEWILKYCPFSKPHDKPTR